jgi:hypothetical protein
MPPTEPRREGPAFNRFGWPMVMMRIFCVSCNHSELREHSIVCAYTGRLPRGEKDSKGIEKETYEWIQDEERELQRFREYKCDGCLRKKI